MNLVWATTTGVHHSMHAFNYIASRALAVLQTWLWKAVARALAPHLLLIVMASIQVARLWVRAYEGPHTGMASFIKL
jgi:hypothetical protein